MGDFYVIELIKDFSDRTNDKLYRKGRRLIVWQDVWNGCYWVANIADIIPESLARKIYKIEFKNICKGGEQKKA